MFPARDTTVPCDNRAADEGFLFVDGELPLSFDLGVSAAFGF